MRITTSALAGFGLALGIDYLLSQNIEPQVQNIPWREIIEKQETIPNLEQKTLTMVPTTFIDSLKTTQKLNKKQNFSLPADTMRITSIYGRRKDPFTNITTFHSGIDLVARINTPINPISKGTVTKIKKGHNRAGNYIEITHNDSTISRYLHLQRRIPIKLGQEVDITDIIGYLGNSGRSTAPHLHLELRVKGIPVDPRQHIPELYNKKTQETAYRQKEQQEELTQTQILFAYMTQNTTTLKEQETHQTKKDRIQPQTQEPEIKTQTQEQLKREEQKKIEEELRKKQKELAQKKTRLKNTQTTNYATTQQQETPRKTDTTYLIQIASTPTKLNETRIQRLEQEHGKITQIQIQGQYKQTTGQYATLREAINAKQEKNHGIIALKTQTREHIKTYWGLTTKK